jgi:hypothetical protein
MIIIKDVEIYKIEGEYCDFIYHAKHINTINKDDTRDLVVNPELIRGRNYYTNIDGEKVYICIGFKKEVQDLLGLPFDEFDRMYKQIDILNKTLIEKDHTIAQIMNLNFWQRLMFVFKGL